ncbi:hypothetical protein Pmani_004208 [Petrolisthes manimaculis]|uniref:Heme-binding protein 1 n=1 Tax=Petrolisthes manimaculis TaxID=1843537 RepID=A0AAE1UNK8_9EUCA|nr:hypothetical protein Pmani_004208 [Petrolisthes manimaculis]
MGKHITLNGIMAAVLKGIRAAFGDVEMAPYTVLVEREGYEERLYPARKWACTTMKGSSLKELMTPMFRILFNYISGKNSPNVRVDMTSPVVTYVEPDPTTRGPATMTMSFLVPGDHQHNPPDPGHKSIFIENRPSITVLVRQFGGYFNDEVLTREVKALTDSVKKQDEKGVIYDKYYVAGYDPPFKLIGRRNEIWFIKTMTEGEEDKLATGITQAYDGVQVEFLESAGAVEDKVKEEDMGKLEAKGCTEDGQEGA